MNINTERKMKEMTEKKEKYNTIITEDCLIDIHNNVIGIGNIADKEGYQKAAVDIKYLKQALELLDKYVPNMGSKKEGKIMIFIKEGQLLQIGSENIGVIIAPRSDID